MADVLIAGCGYLGRVLGLRLVDEGNIVFGLRRRTSELPPEIRLFQADLQVPGMLRKLPTVDWVVCCAGPDEPKEASYRAAFVEGPKNLLAALERQGQKIRRFLFVSSTSVYSQSAGEWVDETSPAEPADVSGSIILEGEQLVTDHAIPSTVVRLGGIYGPGRSRVIDSLRDGSARSSEGPATYQNRIHVADAAGILRHLMNERSPGDLVLGVDSEPAEENSVLRWLAGRMGIEVPGAGSSESGEGEGEAGEDGRPWRAKSNKRCRNDRVLEMGYSFAYPTFREGYGAILEGEGMVV